VLSPPGTLPAIRGRQVADGKPIRRAGPPAARAPEAARQQRRSGTWERYGEQRTVRGQGRSASSPCSYAGSGLARGRCGEDMSTPQKCPPTRHYLQTTSDNRLSASGCSAAEWERRPDAGVLRAFMRPSAHRGRSAGLTGERPLTVAFQCGRMVPWRRYRACHDNASSSRCGVCLPGPVAVARLR